MAKVLRRFSSGLGTSIHFRKFLLNTNKLEVLEEKQPLVKEYSSKLNLFQCARNGYIEEVKSLLKDPQVLADINNVDEEHQAPLHYAARYNHYEIVKLLVEHKAEVNIEDDEGLTPLHYACRINRKRKKKSRSAIDLFENNSSPGTPGMSPRRRRMDPEAACIHYLISNGACITQVDDYKQTPLHHAALRGDEVACDELLIYQTAELMLVHAKDIQDMTPLHTAVSQSHVDIVRMLIKAGADLRCVDDELSTPLHEAAAVDCDKTVKLILNACKKETSKYSEQELLGDKDEDGNTPLMLAIESGSVDTAMLLIDRGSSVSSTNKFLHTPLHLAAISGNTGLEVLKYLLQKGASVEAYNHEHQTPLHKAALYNNLECMKALLDAGANIEVKDRDNFTPLLLAACYGHAAAVELLINSNADILAEDKNERTALFLAAEEDRVEVLQVLLKNKLLQERINQRDKNSDAPLHVASHSGHINIVKCLLDSDADIFCRNDQEKTAIHMAAQGGHVNVIKELASRDSSCINDGDEDSNTALHLAAIAGNVKVVQCLLTIGADVNVRNSTLRTPFACAAEKGYVKTNKILRNFDSQIDLLDKLKLTPLLVATQNGHVEVVKFLLDEKVNLSMTDPYGNNCLDLAVVNDHTEVALEIVKSNRWEEALRNTTVTNGVLDTPLRKLIRKMPEVAQEVFNKCIREQKQEKEGSQQSLNDKYDVIMNYEFLDDMYTIPTWKKSRKYKRKQDKNLKTEKYREPYTKDTEIFKKNHPMMIMVTSDRDELLNHPLVRSLLNYKWRTFGRVFYYVNFFLFMIFLTFLTGYVAVTTPPYLIDRASLTSLSGDSDCQRYQSSGAKHHPFAAVGKYFILIQAFLSIIKEIFQAYQAKHHYISWENLLEVVLFLSSVLFCLDYEDCQRVTGYRTEWQWYFGTIAIFLAWLEFVLFIQKFPMFGIYVVMFKNILNTFFRFFIVFLIFIIAFGMGFFCLLQNQTPYASVWQSILRTTVMMIGEFDYNDIFHGDDYVAYWLTYVLMTVFIVVMSIIIMNLLVGLAVDDIKGVLDQAVLKRMAMQVDLVLDVERIFPRFYSRYYLVEETICTKTQEEAAAIVKPIEEFESEVQKSQKKVLKKVDKMKDCVKDIRRDMTRIEFMLDAIIKAQNINLNMDDA